MVERWPLESVFARVSGALVATPMNLKCPAWTFPPSEFSATRLPRIRKEYDKHVTCVRRSRRSRDARGARAHPKRTAIALQAPHYADSISASSSTLSMTLHTITVNIGDEDGEHVRGAWEGAIPGEAPRIHGQLVSGCCGLRAASCR